MKKRKPLQKLLKLPPKKRRTALDVMKDDLTALATKNGFLVRRAEYLLQQHYLLKMQYEELMRDSKILNDATIALLGRAEALVYKQRRKR